MKIEIDENNLNITPLYIVTGIIIFIYIYNLVKCIFEFIMKHLKQIFELRSVKKKSEKLNGKPICELKKGDVYYLHTEYKNWATEYEVCNVKMFRDKKNTSIEILNNKYTVNTYNTLRGDILLEGGIDYDYIIFDAVALNDHTKTIITTDPERITYFRDKYKSQIQR